MDIFPNRLIYGEIPREEIVNIRIAEYETQLGQDNPDAWYYLIDFTEKDEDVYMSEHDVAEGEYTRVYRDPTLPEDYSKGYYKWVTGREVQPIKIKNEDFKRILKKHEWSV